MKNKINNKKGAEMKNKKLSHVIFGFVILFLIATGCAQNAIPAQVGVVATSQANASNSGLSNYNDLAVQSFPNNPISVKYLVEHRTALNGRTVKVTGIVVDTLLGEKACPVCKTEQCPLRPCARPRIFIADSSDESRDKNYDIMILLDQNDVYKIGQNVEVQGIVESSKAAVVMEKVASANFVSCSSSNECATAQVGFRKVSIGNGNELPIYVCLNKDFVNSNLITLDWAKANGYMISDMIEQKCGCYNQVCSITPIGVPPPPVQ